MSSLGSRVLCFFSFLYTHDSSNSVKNIKTPIWPDCFLAILVIPFNNNVQAGEDQVSGRPEIFCKQESPVSVKDPFIFPVLLYLIVEYLPFSQLKWKPIWNVVSKTPLASKFTPTGRWRNQWLGHIIDENQTAMIGVYIWYTWLIISVTFVFTFIGIEGCFPNLDEMWISYIQKENYLWNHPTM